MAPETLTIVSYVEVPSHHGLSNRVLGIARSMTARGIACRIICPDTQGLPSRDDIDSIVVRRIRIRGRERVQDSSLPIRILKIVAFMFQSFVLVRHLTPKRSDMIMVEQVAGLPLILMLKLFHRRRTIVDDMTLLHVDYSFAPKALLRLIDLMCIGLSDVVVTTTDKTVNFVGRSLPSKRCVKVENGVNTPTAPAPRINTEKRGQPLRMVFVGGLSFHQNRQAIRHILTIVDILSEWTSDFQVRIVGGPISMADEYLSHPAVKEGLVEFTGFLSDERLEEEFSEALIGLLPFFRDSQLMAGQRTKALEYFARRLLVLSGPEGIGEIQGLSPGEGYIEAQDASTFAAHLSEIAKNPTQYEPIRNHGFEVIQEKYSWEATTRVLHQAIRKTSH